jgi:hypothetical protein
VEKTKGQIDYEADVGRKPVYYNGTTRKHWTKLSDIARWSWERQVSDKMEEDKNGKE